MYGGAAAPPGWVLCDGTIYAQATYPALFAAIGLNFNASPGAGNFQVPDMRSRIPIGAGAGSGLTARTLGTTGGQETVTLSANQNGQHTHTLNNHTHAQGNHAHNQSDVIGTFNTTSGGNVAAAFNPANAGIINNQHSGTKTGFPPGTADIFSDAGTAAAAGTAANSPPVTLATPLMNPWECVTFIIKT